MKNVRIQAEVKWCHHLSSVQSCDQLGDGVLGVRDKSAEILFQSFCFCFCRRWSLAVLAWGGTPALWCCPSSISSAYHNVATLQDPVNDGFGEAVVAHDMPESCKFSSLDSCWKRSLWAHKEVDLALHTCRANVKLKSSCQGHRVSQRHLVRIWILTPCQPLRVSAGWT